MAFSSYLLLLLTHPYEFRTLVQFKLYHEYKRDITAPTEHATSGWDRESMRKCWDFLDQTSRSFSVVIKELEGDLARVICLFYLVLRGLDTIEDDMSLDQSVKQPLLRDFHKHTVTPGWNFAGNGSREKDRELLVQYHYVVEEINRLAPEYREVILDLCEKMAVGMADFAAFFAKSSSEKNPSTSIPTVQLYDLYCHYVAGIVGEGLSRLFSASGKEAPWLGQQLELSNSFGLLLQKTNIIRDFREDFEENRCFWPQEVWGSPAYGSLTSLSALTLPKTGPVDPDQRDRALFVLSEMVLDALRHAPDVLTYLRFLKNQSVFNFCAIPASMALATLELVYGNEDVFKRNIKIRRAHSASLIMRSTNPREVACVFREYARKIHAKATPKDPNFIKIGIACGKIEQWCETYYPSFVQVNTNPGAPASVVMDPLDARTRIHQLEVENDEKLSAKRREYKIRNGIAGSLGAVQGGAAGPASDDAMIYLFGGMALVLAICGLTVGGVLFFSGSLDQLGL